MNPESWLGMKGALLNFVDKVLIPRPPEVIGVKAPTILESVEQARKEWVAARTYFETVTDPDLIDHAIYLLEAARRKYDYMLRIAREGEVKAGIS